MKEGSTNGGEVRSRVSQSKERDVGDFDNIVQTENVWGHGTWFQVSGLDEPIFRTT